MRANEDIAAAYIQLLRQTEPAQHLLDSKVTKKGGAPAQTAKRLILGRLIQSRQHGPLTKVRGDLYRLEIDGRITNFRFAVTTSGKQLPWFNITETELETLTDIGAVLLVVWNSSLHGRWCKMLSVFAVAASELLQGYRANAPLILQSMLQVAFRKLIENEPLMPALVAVVRRNVDIDSFTDLPDIVRLNEARRQFSECVKQYRDSQPDPSASNELDTRYIASKIRDRLYALLLRIDPNESLSQFAVRHKKTDSLLLEGDSQLCAPLDLGELESDCLRLAYDGDSPSSVSSEDGVETDDDSSTSNQELINRPYDPTKSKIDTRVVTIDLLCKRISENEIDLAPSFQRKAGLWSSKQKSQLIESLLIRIPLPAFYFDATDDSRWLVVDGLQRLTTFKDFLLEDMELNGLEYLTAYDGKTFKDLPRSLQRIIQESQVTVHLIQPGTPAEVKFNIFRRINTGGLALTLQEIRHALNQGPVIRLLSELASSGEFAEATTHSISSERMADRELVLRFLAFTVTSFQQYRVPDMDVFLSVEMGRLNKLQNRFQELRGRFVQAMDTARAIFGSQAFRKQYYIHQSRSPINKALFESWSVTLGALTSAQSATLIERKKQVTDAAIVLNNTDDFHRAISQGTQDVAKVKKRFECVQGLVEGVLNDTIS